MTTDLPGFTDPVREAQSAFRAILGAMSRPGTVQALSARLAPPSGLSLAAAATLLTLVDADTSLHMNEAGPAARDWVMFHCGPKLALSAADADFVLAATLPDLASLADGSDDGPEGGATLILEVLGLGRGASYTLAGPGLEAPTTVSVDGLPADFAARWAANHARFPRGVDLILCAGSEVMAFPRTLAIANLKDMP